MVLVRQTLQPPARQPQHQSAQKTTSAPTTTAAPQHHNTSPQHQPSTAPIQPQTQTLRQLRTNNAPTMHQQCTAPTCISRFRMKVRLRSSCSFIAAGAVYCTVADDTVNPARSACNTGIICASQTLPAVRRRERGQAAGRGEARGGSGNGEEGRKQHRKHVMCMDGNTIANANA